MFYLSLIGIFAALALSAVVLASSEFRGSLASFSVDWVTGTQPARRS